MAGRARTQALSEELSSRTRECFEIDPVDVAIGAQSVPTHLDYVCAWVERGQTVKALAQDLSVSLDFDFPYDALMRYLRFTFGAERADQSLTEARARASHSMAEDAIAIVDAPAYDKVDVARAQSRARSRQWLAERWNPQAFGQSKGVNVSISVTQLHLQALQAIPNTVTSGLQSIANNSGLNPANEVQAIALQSLSSE